MITCMVIFAGIALEREKIPQCMSILLYKLLSLAYENIFFFHSHSVILIIQVI